MQSLRAASITSNMLQLLPSSLGNVATAAYFKINAYRQNGRNGFHSSPKIVAHQQNMRIKILPALSDNYMYLIIDDATKEAAIVDPVDPESVVRAVSDEKVKLSTVLTTHHHWDHAGGNKKMRQMVPELKFYGGEAKIDCLDTIVKHGDVFKVGDLNIRCLFTPCHTSGHICYLASDGDQPPAVFTGDTLFLGGCGRFFEGTAKEMDEALNGILSSLPDETKVYCGHEYAIQNLKFGLHVEPQNVHIINLLKKIEEMRKASPPEPSVPSTIGQEKLVNPFMRVGEPSVRAHVGGLDDDVEVMKALRKEKDGFKAK